MTDTPDKTPKPTSKKDRTITLKHPVTYGGREIAQLTMRDVIYARDEIAVGDIAAKNMALAEARLIANLCDVDEEVIFSLQKEDWVKAQIKLGEVQGDQITDPQLRAKWSLLYSVLAGAAPATG